MHRFDRRVAATRGFGPGGTTNRRHDGMLGRRFDGDDGIASVHRTLEDVSAFDRHHVGDLRDAEQRGNAGHQVLAERRAGTEHMRVTGGEFRHLRGLHLCDGIRVRGIRDGQHLRHAGDLRRFCGHARRIGGEHEEVDGLRLQRLRGGHALGGGCVELATEVFGDDQDLGHHSNPFCFSAATSSAASFTITPRLRLAGAA
jgi:hypothetical protein